MNKHVSSFTYKPEVHLKLHIASIYTHIATRVASPNNTWFLFFCETRHEEQFSEDHAKLSLTASTVTDGIMRPLCRLLREGYY